MPSDEKKSDQNPRIVLCASILALGFILAACIFSASTPRSPVQINYPDYSASYGYQDTIGSDIINFEELQRYLDLYPEHLFGEVEIPISSGENITVVSPSDMEAVKNSELIEAYSTEVQASILAGEWGDFPYLQIRGRLYFSKKAIAEWFYENSKQQLTID